MIKRLIKNELNLKRWRRFKRSKRATLSAIFLFISTLATFTAPLLSNSRPIILAYEGLIYFPIFSDYHPKEFGITDSLVVDYRLLDEEKISFSLWPLFKWDPFESNHQVSFYPSPPTSLNLLGTDDRGRDVLARLLYGFKYSLLYAVFVWLISTVLGTIAGGMMGYFGGRVDFFGQRIVETLATVPQFFLLLILISIFKPTLFWLILISCLFGWISISYYVRAEFLKLRKREFVEAARGLGAGHGKIIFKHILPNSLGPVITFAPFMISSSIIGLASLDYLGFGLAVPTPSWGELLNQAQKNFTTAWWLAVYPSLCLFGSLVCLNLVGEGVRDAMDPHL